MNQDQLVLDPLLFVKNSKHPMHARNSFENKTFKKKIIKKPQKSYLDFILIQSFPMDKIMINKV